MFYVRLLAPLPGVRSEVFVFYSEAEAEEFASCLHSRYAARTITAEAGEASEVFPEWSF